MPADVKEIEQIAHGILKSLEGYTAEERRLAVYYLLRNILGERTTERVPLVDPDGTAFGYFLPLPPFPEDRAAELRRRSECIDPAAMLPTENLLDLMRANDEKALRQLHKQIQANGG